MAKELSDYKASLSDEEIKKLIEDTEHLKKYQEEPSSDEDLRKLPMLTRADMKKNAMPFSNIEDELLDVKVVRHDIESNGIDYISFLFDAGDFAQSELGYLGFFTNALAGEHRKVQLYRFSQCHQHIYRRNQHRYCKSPGY